MTSMTPPIGAPRDAYEPKKIRICVVSSFNPFSGSLTDVTQLPPEPTCYMRLNRSRLFSSKAVTSGGRTTEAGGG